MKVAGFQIVADNSNKIEAANGREMDILGTCTFEATYQATGKTMVIMALVVKDICDSLISWHDLIELGWELKHQLRTVKNPSDMAVQESMSVFFVLKPDGVRVRMVTDFTALNNCTTSSVPVPISRRNCPVGTKLG